jgi:hypothetical protein
MKPLRIAVLTAALTCPAWTQSNTADQAPTATTTPDQTHSDRAKKEKKGRSPGGDVASGSGNIVGGAAKGAGHAAEGVGKGVGDAVTLHPIDAATAVGKGGAQAGKDVTVGTTKGTAKIVKGVGRGIKHLF